jgi:hypothetical protein
VSTNARAGGANHKIRVAADSIRTIRQAPEPERNAAWPHDATRLGEPGRPAFERMPQSAVILLSAPVALACGVI